MPSKILPAGTLRAVHVYVPALQARIKDGGNEPVWAVRSVNHKFKRMLLVRQARILGESEGVEMFDAPLPGTGGRGVAPLLTRAAIEITWDEGDHPKMVNFTEAEADKPAPVAPPAPPRKGLAEAWYKSRSGRLARYTLLGYANNLRIARLQGVRDGVPFTFRVNSRDIEVVS